MEKQIENQNVGALLNTAPEDLRDRIKAIDSIPLHGNDTRLFAVAVQTIQERLEKPRAYRLLVVGECGDGKSTLVNALRDPSRGEPKAKVAKAARGVTKEITSYTGLAIDKHPITILDTPGIGDMDVQPAELLALLEDKLVSRVQGEAAPIDGVLVTAPIGNNRVKFGAQVVQMLVEKGFVGDDKWANVILVGTKDDKADDGDRECFQNDVVPTFFEKAPDKSGLFVLTNSPNNFQQLRETILKLPAFTVQYERPDPDEMASAFAAKMGVDQEEFKKNLQATRGELEEQFKKELEGMHKQIEQLQQEAAKREAEQQEELRRQQAEAAALREQLAKRPSRPMQPGNETPGGQAADDRLAAAKWMLKVVLVFSLLNVFSLGGILGLITGCGHAISTKSAISSKYDWAMATSVFVFAEAFVLVLMGAIGVSINEKEAENSEGVNELPLGIMCLVMFLLHLPMLIACPVLVYRLQQLGARACCDAGRVTPVA